MQTSESPVLSKEWCCICATKEQQQNRHGRFSFCDCVPLCEFYAGGQAVMAQLLGAGASDPDIEARLD